MRHLAVACVALIACGKPEGVTSGTLRLRTYPPGAKVWIDGELKVESTPATLILKEGRYHVRIQATGAEALEREVEVEAGEANELNLSIPKPPEATVSVLSDVEGAKVRVNGYTRGTTPLWRKATKPGPIDVTVTSPEGHAKSVRGQLAIGEQKILQVFFDDVTSDPEDGQDKRPDPIRMSLPPPLGWVTIGLNPEGEVFDAEGKSLGRTPIQKMPLEAGEHELVLRSRDAKYEKKMTIEVEEGKTAIYRFSFTEADKVVRF